MLTRIRRRLSSDEGLTLVEMIVALFILGVILAALASTLSTSMRQIVTSESRLMASQLANEVLEELHAWDWDDLDSFPTTRTFTRRNVEFTVASQVEWIDVAAVAGDENYREFTVEVSWGDRGTTRSIITTATRAPLPDEADPGLFGLREATVTPNIGYLRSDDGRLAKDGQGNGVTQVALRAVTTAPLDADGVTVTFTNRYGATIGPIAMEGSVENTVWTLASSSWHFVNGDTEFRIRAQSESDFAEVTVVARYVHENISVPELAAFWQESGAGEDPAREPREYVCLNLDGTSAEDIVVQAGFRGLTSDDAVTVTGGGVDDMAYVAGPLWMAESGNDALVGTVFEYLIEEGHQFPLLATEVTFTVIGERGMDGVVGPAGGATVTLDVRQAAVDPECAS
jgi:prepilin-type N-terminal cleavage/methylation domain-containing protein